MKNNIKLDWKKYLAWIKKIHMQKLYDVIIKSMQILKKL